MQLSYSFSNCVIQDKDFSEGIRAFEIDKDNNPKWKHASIYDVKSNEIEAYFKKRSDLKLNSSK